MGFCNKCETALYKNYITKHHIVLPATPEGKRKGRGESPLPFYPKLLLVAA
jgi:hypothetical protein